MLESATAEQAFSTSRYSSMASSASNAVIDKMRSAKGDRPFLPPQAGQSRREALLSAHRAASEMGLLSHEDAGVDPEEWVKNLLPVSEASSVTESSTPSATARGRRKERIPSAPRIGPLEFSLAARAAGWEAPGGIDACDLFSILDKNCDGGVTLEELRGLETDFTDLRQVDAAVALLLQRRGGDMDAAAQDLAGDRSSVDRVRITECLIVAGIEEAAAHRIAGSLVHCCEGAPQGSSKVQATLVHAFGAFVAARNAELLVDFRRHIHGRFPRCEEAFWVLNESQSGAICWEEFLARVKNPLRWPSVNLPGAPEAIFHCLDVDGSGHLDIQAFQLLEAFDVTATMEAMLLAGRIISRGRAGSCPIPLCPPPSMLSDTRCLTRAEFRDAWQELPSERCKAAHAGIVFGLVDINGNNFVEQGELALLSDSLRRRAEAATAGELAELFKRRFGSLEAMHALLLRRDAHTALIAMLGKASEHSGTAGYIASERPRTRTDSKSDLGAT
jgi:hypothetical protein